MSVSYGTYTITDHVDGSQIWTTTVAPTIPNYTFTISNLSGDDNADIKIGDVIFYDTYRYTVTSVGATTVLAPIRMSIKGEDGSSPTVYKLIVSHSVIGKREDGTYNPGSIHIEAKQQTGIDQWTSYTGRIKIDSTVNNEAWDTHENSNMSSCDFTIPVNVIAVRCSLYIAGGNTVLLDQHVIPIIEDGIDGKDAYSVILTNESHTFVAGTTAAVGGSATSNVIAYKGATQVTCYVGSSTSTSSIDTGITGLTCQITNNNSTNVTLTFVATNELITSNGIITIPVHVDGKTFNKIFTFSLALSGNNGEDGKMLYGTCSDTAIGTAAKVVTCVEATELYAGLAITIKFVKGNSASAPTLNVNRLGAKNIYFGGANISSSNLFIFAANSEIQFVYNGTAFVPVGYPCAYYGTCSTAAGTAAKVSTIAQAVICKGTVVNLQMTNANTVADPTLNISSTGAKAIYANGAKPTANSPYNWIASSTVSFTFDGQYWRLGDTSSLNKIDVVNTLAQSAKDTADSKVTTYYSASTSAPSNPSTGDLWIKTDNNNSLWRYNGSSWISVDNSNIQTALTNAASAQSTADGKIVTYAQDNQPNTGSEGDLWIDTNDNNKLYRYNETSSTWVEVAPEYLIGGRNLLRYDVKNYAIVNNNKIASNANYRGMYCACEGGQIYTVSRKVVEGNRFQIATTEVEPAVGVACNMIFSSDNTALQHTFTTPASANYIFLYLSNQGDTINNGNIKVEKGNIPTDWTPTPEDVDSAISEAQSTADAALSQSVWYATCNTGAAEVAKVATISPSTTNFELKEGATVNVKFSITNSGAIGDLTLNVNNTGAKSIKYIYNGSYSNIPSAGYLKANQMYKFAYDGTYWVVELIYNTNTNTVGVYGGTGFIAGTNGIKQYSLIMEDGNGTWQSFTTTYGTGTSKPRNTVGFKPNKILYMSGKDNYAAGSACTTCYDGYSINLQYSTNCGTTLVIGKPVYLVGTINNNDGLFYLEPTWWTQTEPVIEDGCIYIYLGTAYNTSSIYFTPENPIYIFKYGEFMKLTEATEIEAATALATANGKNTSYYQAEEPTLGTYKDGDTWFKMGLANIDGTKTGSIVSVDGDVKINDLVVDINAVQAGSGDPSPTNVRSISGWDAVHVTRTGKNLWGGDKLKDDILAKVTEATVDTTNKTVSYSAQRVAAIIFLDGIFKPDTQYTIILKGDNTHTTTKTPNLQVNYTDGGRDNSFRFVNGVCVFTSTVGKTIKSIQGVWMTSTTTLYYDECGIFEGVLTAVDFVPYTGTTYPISWQTEAGTVYGGTVDLVSGVLTVDMAMVDLGTLDWRTTSPSVPVGYAYRATISDRKYGTEIVGLCEQYDFWGNGTTATLASNLENGQVGFQSTVSNIWIRDDRYSTIAAFTEAMSGIKLVYPLKTPQTYQLTPPQISLLANQTNNIWADTGDITLTGSVKSSDAAVEVYQRKDDEWVLTPYGSGVFATIDAGKITTGTLSTILIKSNNNDYWNLSPIDVTDGNMVYKANTLQTNHLIAEDDIYIDGGSGSYFKIPTADNELSYIEIDDDGMTIQSTTNDNSESITTVYPSDKNAVIDVLDDSHNWDTALVNNAIYVSLQNSNLVQTITADFTCNEYDTNGNYVEQISSYQDWTLRSKGVTNAVQTPGGLKIYSDYKETFDDYIVPSGPYEGYKYVPIGNSLFSNNYFSKKRAVYGAGELMLAEMTNDYVRNFEINLESGEIIANGSISGYDVGTDCPWKFTLNGRRLDVYSLKVHNYNSAEVALNTAYGWKNTVSTTIPANNTGVTLVWRVTVAGYFYGTTQWAIRGLRINRDGTDMAQELYTAPLANQVQFHTHIDFITQVAGANAISITAKALSSDTSVKINSNHILAEVVHYY